jgi:hypothetical protein
VAAVAANGVGSEAVGNGGNRLGSTSSNFRFTWWSQAWHGFRDHVLNGSGAGSFHLLNLRYRTTYLDFTIEPHDLPVQMLAELGVVGLALLVVACIVLLRGSLRRSGHELALALLLPAFLVHSLVDVDWDFAAVAAPAFVAAGALVGGPVGSRVRGAALLPAFGVGILVLGSLVSPWLAHRWADDALFSTNPGHAIALADRAHSLDPLLVDPYTAKALAYDARNEPRRAFDEYVAAVRRQPKNPETWLAAGRYAWTERCPYLAYTYLEKYTELDQKARSDRGGDLYNEALARVNNRQYTC